MLRSLFLHITCPLLFALGLGVAISHSQAAVVVHYLMIQADSNPSVSGLETYKFKFQYDDSVTPALTKGMDLLTTLFGPISPTPVEIEGGDYYLAQNGNFGATYQNFGSPGTPNYFVSQFTLFGTTVPSSVEFDGTNYWGYEVSGGSGTFAPVGGYAATSTWLSADDGASTRTLVNGSFDGWVYGPGATTPPTETGNQATAGDFSNLNYLLFTTASGISVYSATPEPGRVLLAFIGVALLFFKRARRSMQPVQV